MTSARATIPASAASSRSGAVERRTDGHLVTPSGLSLVFQPGEAFPFSNSLQIVEEHVLPPWRVAPDVDERFSDDFVAVVSEDLRRLAVPELEDSLVVRGDDRIGRRFDDGLEESVGLAEFALAFRGRSRRPRFR